MGLNPGTTYYYQVCVSNNGGQSCKTGSIQTKIFADVVKIGDYIRMTPTSTSYTISIDATGYTSNQTINPRELNLWRVIRKNDDGTIDVVSEYVSSTNVYFQGETGFKIFGGALKQICSSYRNNVFTISCRIVGEYDQQETFGNLSSIFLLNDQSHNVDLDLINSSLGRVDATDRNGNKKDYWIPSRYVFHFNNSDRGYSLKYIEKSGEVRDYPIAHMNINNLIYDEFSYSASIRPILILNPNIVPNSGNGTEMQPYVLR